MRPSCFSFLLAVSTAPLGATPNLAEQICKPVLTTTATHISEPKNMQRTWTAVLMVDASKCATTSGRFEIELARLKENAPDIRFTERFTWTPGRTEISLDIWWDEWLHDPTIGHVERCPCRG